VRSARLLAIVAVVAAGACGSGDGLEAREVRVRVPEQRLALEVDGCGRDGDLVVLGASSASALLQVLLRMDGDEVDLARSGITVEIGGRGVLGAGDPDLIASAAGAAGTIRSASVRGDRIEVSADAIRVSAGASVEEGRVEVAARCTAPEDLAAPER
jgi:hypothetical protein